MERCILNLFEAKDRKEDFLALYKKSKIPQEFHDLIDHMKELVEQDKEVNSTNIFLLKKDRKVLAQFMEVDMSYWKEEFKN